jgi:hygromycin-B 4-O-kinase
VPNDALDPALVARFLHERFGQAVSAIEPVGHGEWSKAFFFHFLHQADRDLVIRFSAFEDDFRKDERAARYASPRVPIPTLLEIGPAFDRLAYAVSERARGEFLEQRDAAAMRRLLPSLLAVLDALRAVDVSGTSGFGLWRGADGAAPHASWRDALLAIATDPPSSRAHGWRDRLSAFAAASQAFDAGYRRMQALVDACPNQRHLLHSDLLYFNVLVRDDRLSAVLDWGSSMYGDWLWDLAWLTFWQPWYTAWADVDLRAAAERHFRSIGLDVPNFAERLRCYELAIGLDGLAYQSFAGHTDNLAWTTQRVLGLLSTE